MTPVETPDPLRPTAAAPVAPAAPAAPAGHLSGTEAGTVHGAVKLVDVAAKTTLVVMLVAALVDPDGAHLRDKGAEARAIGYTAAAFALPALWFALWQHRVRFPWLADTLITVTCFSDILGNRLDLYDSIWWFDDWMHFFNLVLLAAAVIVLTLPRTASLGALVERALAFGATAAIAWELAEYAAFLSESTEKRFAYEDTLGDLGLGVVGAVVGAWVVHRLWARGRLRHAEPVVQVPPAGEAPTAGQVR
ncbi:hypothetical protein RDV89_03500 [Nocardioides zeae]|uniref:VanZ-like domain-containing protein n=1 Tax=Nocardioides imazamoxiresistens TaxID=3231893 RepID=A0ABU3PSA6_9ACTN|nr:hypothetical protein [Nocardioides zeae]MDT9592115.1 hypothetical protein [Nocardioides zeae]